MVSLLTSSRLLNERQRIFVDALVETGLITEAAKRSGYSKPHGIKMMNDREHYAHVQEAVAEGRRERAKRCQIDADWVLSSLHDLYQRCVQEVKPALNSKTGKPITDDGGNPLYTFNANAALKALELIAKHTDVGALGPQKVMIDTERDLIERLQAGRARVARAKLQAVDVLETEEGE